MGYISAATINDNVIVWERDELGQRIEQPYSAEYYFYYDDPKGKYTTIYDTPVSKRTFKNGADYRDEKAKFEREGIRTWESDFSPEIRILSNHYYGKPAPKLNITFLDIEVDYDKDLGFASVYNPYAPVNSVSIFHYHTNRLVVFCVPPTDDWTEERLLTELNAEVPVPTNCTFDLFLCKDEKMLLLGLLEEIQDSDLVCGWNSEFFDFPYIYRRVEITLGKAYINKLSFPRARRINLVEKEVPRFGQDVKTLKLEVNGCGRMFSDYMELYRKYEFGERSSYKLASIADIVLVDEKTGQPSLPKLEYNGTLFDLYRNDFAFFVRYNIRDTEILRGFEDKLAYVELANQMYHLSTALYQHVSGTLKLAEFAIVNHCHHKLKRVVPNVRTPDVDQQIDGAMVLEPKIGLHEMLGSIDINSLYPSAIRSINISPETLRGQFVEKVTATECIRSIFDPESMERALTLMLEDGTKLVKTAAGTAQYSTKPCPVSFQQFLLSGTPCVRNTKQRRRELLHPRKPITLIAYNMCSRSS
jgi:DNA polymerase elongation subunit (family B)